MYHRSADISCLAHLACDFINITCNLLTYFQEDGHLCSCTSLLLKVCVYTAGARLHYLGPKGRSTQPFFRVLLSLSFGPRDAYSRDGMVATPLSLPVSFMHLCLSIPKSFQFCLMTLVENIKSGTRIQDTFAFHPHPHTARHLEGSGKPINFVFLKRQESVCVLSLLFP